MASTLLVQIASLTSGLNHSRPVSNLFWPTALMPNLLAIRQSRNLFNFEQYELFIDYIFHVLHTKFVFKICVHGVLVSLCSSYSPRDHDENKVYH